MALAFSDVARRSLARVASTLISHLEVPMKALKRLAASTMLALALVTGATQTVAAQDDSLACEYLGTDIIITPDAIYIIDYYWC